MNLTSLAAVRGWIGSTTDTDNALITRLIADASRMAMNYMQRPELGLTTITETISGKGTRKIQLRNWPVIAVNSLTINAVLIPQSVNAVSYGWFLEPLVGGLAGRAQNLGIVGAGTTWAAGYSIGYNSDGGVVSSYCGGSGCRPFPLGVGNIAVNYAYGYTVQAEAQTIPAASTYTIAPSCVYGSWARDNGVTLADGTPLVAIASGTPVTGQYVPPSVAGDSPSQVYTFAAADHGKDVLLSYDYVPYDLEQAVIEIVGERYRYRSRIGESSKTLGGQETSSYLVKDALAAAIKARLVPYRLAWAG